MVGGAGDSLLPLIYICVHALIGKHYQRQGWWMELYKWPDSERGTLAPLLTTNESLTTETLPGRWPSTCHKNARLERGGRIRFREKGPHKVAARKPFWLDPKRKSSALNFGYYDTRIL